MYIDELDAALKEVAPITGVNSDGVIFFLDNATSDQRAAAQAIVDENLSTLVPTHSPVVITLDSIAAQMAILQQQLSDLQKTL